MEMDYNLKTFAKFFKFFPCILEKSLKTDYSLFFLREISFRYQTLFKSATSRMEELNLWKMMP